jgi:hypothetical protein
MWILGFLMLTALIFLSTKIVHDGLVCVLGVGTYGSLSAMPLNHDRYGGTFSVRTQAKSFNITNLRFLGEVKTVSARPLHS